MIQILRLPQPEHFLDFRLPELWLRPSLSIVDILKYDRNDQGVSNLTLLGTFLTFWAYHSK